MSLTVSLNGADNVGKTTQTEFLERNSCKQIGRSAIHHYDSVLSELVEKNKLREWWWKCGNEEHVQSIVRGLNSRASSLKVHDSEDVLYLDRGANMFKAVCIATIAVKNYCSLQAARRTFDCILSSNKLQIPTNESVRILLKHSVSVEESVRKTLSMEIDIDDTYTQYQLLLQNQLQYQEENREFTDIIYVGSKSKLDVQNEIRQVINRYLVDLKKPCLPLVLTSLKTVVVFGGMSECGKSTLASKTSSELNSRGLPCHRLKIGYLLRNANYSSSAVILAQHLVDELDNYLKWHHFLSAVTLESLHRFELARELKHFFGDTLQIVYLDVGIQTRTKRALCSLEELRYNDEVKSKRGALQVKEIADLVVDNENNGIDESTNIILSHLGRTLKIKQNSSYNFCVFSDEFVLSAGAVLVKMSTSQVCLVHMKKTNEWTLPKGRKNEGETLEKTALRETFEETGYQCKIMPAVMATRAPPRVENGHSPDVVRMVTEGQEPFSITCRVSAASGSRKIIFWFVAEVLEEHPQSCYEKDKFDVAFKTFQEALDLISFEDDKCVLRRAAKMIEDTSGQRMLQKCAK